MAAVIQDPSLQTVQPSNSGGAQSFGQSTQTTSPSNSQANQGVTFNQPTSNNGQGQQSSTSSGRNKPQGTGFTNVNNILSANQGNNLGQTIETGINNAAQGVQQGLTNAAGSFNQGVQANLLNTSQNNQNVQNTVNNASNLQAGQTIDPTQLAQFQTYTAGGYQGPTGLQNADLLQGQAQAAQQLGQDVNSSGGQQNLLQKFVGNGQYTQGQQTLDQLLLGQQQGALNQAQGNTFGLTNQANTAATNANQIANQAVDANKAFGQQAVLAAQNAQTPITTNINNAITSDIQNQNQVQTNYNNLQKLLGESASDYSKANPVDPNNPNAAQSSGNPAVDQLNSIFSTLQNAGVDQNTIQQLAGPALQANINNIPGYLNTLMNNINLNTQGGLTVSNPDTTGYGTSAYQVNPNDVSSLANQTAVTSAQQAAQLNALSQLAGGTGNINAAGVGTYNPEAVNVNLANILPSSTTANTASGGGSTPQLNTASPVQQVGGALTNLASAIPGDVSPVAGSTIQGYGSGLTNAANQLSQGNIGGAASSVAKTPITVGSNLLGQLASNPLGSVVNNPVSIASNLASQISNPIAAVFGGGGGGKIICNELHRQGYISDKVIRLDEDFGKKYRRLNPDAYRGYLLVATPIVALMKRNKLFTKVISKISLPWASFMANTMDKSIEGSKLGYAIHHIGMFVFPRIYKISKFIKRVEREYKTI